MPNNKTLIISKLDKHRNTINVRFSTVCARKNKVGLRRKIDDKQRNIAV
jgi:hypothetical protein